MYRATTSLEPISLAPLLEGKVGIWTHHWKQHAANGPLSGSAISVPTPSRDSSGWQPTGASLWIYKHGNHGIIASCWWFSGQPSFHTNSSSTPSRPERSCRTILNKAWSGMKVPVAARLWRMWMMVARVRSTWPAIALCRMPSQASASTSCLITIWVGWGIIRTISEKWEKICNCWFEFATVQRQIWGNDHLSCSFGLWRPHLALK